MGVERYSNRQGKQQCPKCGLWFKRLKAHEGSQKCKDRVSFKHIIDPIEAEHERLVALGKTQMTKVFSNALQRRNLDELVGLVFAISDYEYPTMDGGIKKIERPWVDNWVAQCYEYNLRLPETLGSGKNPAYEELMRIKDATDREAAISLAMLKWTEL